MRETTTRARLTTLLLMVASVGALLPVSVARAETVFSIDEFSIPARVGTSASCPGCPSVPTDLTVGPGGAIWFTEKWGNRIGRIDPDGGSVDEWVIPTDDSQPGAIVADEDGILWFVENGASQLGAFDPATATFSEFPIPGQNGRILYGGACCTSDQLTLGPDGAIWFAMYNTVTRFDPRTHESTYSDMSTQGTSSTGGPYNWVPDFQGITSGKDGKLYLTDVEGQGIWQIDAGPFPNPWEVVWSDPAANNRARFFPIPGTSPLCYGCYQPESLRLLALAAASDGAIWFTATDGWFGRMTPSGDFDLFEVGLRTAGTAITAGPDGAMWFLGMGEMPGGNVAPSIGRIGPNGGLTVYPHSSMRQFWFPPYGSIIEGPPGEGSLWYTDPWENNVGRFRIGSLSAGGTATTGGAATPANPIQVSVTSPSAGPVSIRVRPTDQPAPNGYTFLDQQVDIEAPAGSPDQPLYIQFRIDESILPGDLDPSGLQVFRNGVALGPCNFENLAESDPCAWEQYRDGGDLLIAVFTSHASAWNFSVRPPLPFEGFFAPVDNAPTFNTARAGSAIPMRFGLGGDHGLDVVAPGYPQASAIDCNSGAPLDTIEQTVAAGASGLSYDERSGRYLYVWKTSSAWAGTCRQFVLKLSDGSTHTAEFSFVK